MTSERRYALTQSVHMRCLGTRPGMTKWLKVCPRPMRMEWERMCTAPLDSRYRMCCIKAAILTSEVLLRLISALTTRALIGKGPFEALTH